MGCKVQGADRTSPADAHDDSVRMGSLNGFHCEYAH